MIIRIDDAPSIKNIKIDISFDDDTTIVNNQTLDQSSININKSNTIETTNTQDKKSQVDEVQLNLDENFNINDEVINIPVIEETEREVKISTDMNGAEF